MSVLTDFIGSGIKSRQSGSVAVFSSSGSGTVTISSVDTNKAFVIYKGTATISTNYQISSFLLTNSTTLTYTFAGNGSGTAYWEVIELY